jgi:hypothetical protein
VVDVFNDGGYVEVVEDVVNRKIIVNSHWTTVLWVGNAVCLYS